MSKFTWEDEYWAGLCYKIDRFGFTVIYVGGECDVPGCEGRADPENFLPEYGYTIALPHKFDHPELILLGLDPRSTHHILNTLVHSISHGRAFSTGDIVEFDEFIVKLGSCHVFYLRQGITAFSIDYHEMVRASMIPAPLQVMWADQNDRFPDHHDFDPEFRGFQPVLSSLPPRRYRRRRPVVT
ncbi:MAG: DUF4262 domain-containing protein [Actinomycetota bacterium]